MKSQLHKSVSTVDTNPLSSTFSSLINSLRVIPLSLRDRHSTTRRYKADSLNSDLNRKPYSVRSGASTPKYSRSIFCATLSLRRIISK